MGGGGGISTFTLNINCTQLYCTVLGYMGDECLNVQKIYLPQYDQSIVEPSKINANHLMAVHANINPPVVW